MVYHHFSRVVPHFRINSIQGGGFRKYIKPEHHCLAIYQVKSKSISIIKGFRVPNPSCSSTIISPLPPYQGKIPSHLSRSIASCTETLIFPFSISLLHDASLLSHRFEPDSVLAADRERVELRLRLSRALSGGIHALSLSLSIIFMLFLFLCSNCSRQIRTFLQIGTEHCSL